MRHTSLLSSLLYRFGRACRFAPTEMVRLDNVLCRLFGWSCAAEFKAILRLFGRFDMLTNERVQGNMYRWLFGKLPQMKFVTLDFDSSVITRNGQQEGAVRGYNPVRRGRASHHPLLAFIAEFRLVANFWLRSGNVHSANNVLQFLESTLAHLADKTIGLLRADSGFFDDAFLSALELKHIPYIVTAKLTYPLQLAIYGAKNWWALKQGIEIAEIEYQAIGWKKARRIIIIRQSISDREPLGKNLGLFPDDPAVKGWLYGAYVPDLKLPAVEVWRTYRGRAAAENRIKELKADFGLDAFNMKKFWVIEAALSFAMLAYNLMSLFRQTVMRCRVKHTLSTLHGMVLAVGGSWKGGTGENHLLLSVPRKKRAWFSACGPMPQTYLHSKCSNGKSGLNKLPQIASSGSPPITLSASSDTSRGDLNKPDRLCATSPDILCARNIYLQTPMPGAGTTNDENRIVAIKVESR